MPATSAYALALTTAPSLEKAAEIARALVSEGLAACVNIVPGVRSIYRWKGKVEDEAEVLCVIKTRAARVADLKARLPALHPYEVPELVVLPIQDGHPPYLAWLDASSS